MDRSGCASGTRAVAMKLWKGRLPARPASELVEELYHAENRGKSEPSGSQDMAGLIYPGVSRLDYDFRHTNGVFPSAVQSITEARVIRWLEKVLYLLPIEPRPDGYNPLGEKQLEPRWIQRLGETGKNCFHAIRHRDLNGLGAALNECGIL